MLLKSVRENAAVKIDESETGLGTVIPPTTTITNQLFCRDGQLMLSSQTNNDTIIKSIVLLADGLFDDGALCMYASGTAGCD